MAMIPNFFDRAWDPFEGWPMTMPMPMPMPIRTPMVGLGFPFEASSFARAAVDRKETPSEYVFKVKVPGLKKEEVKVTVDGGVLHISGERRHHKEETADGWHRMESSSGSFSRRFRLPENAKVDQLRVAMEGGALTVSVPKVESPRRSIGRSIEISNQ